MQQTQGAIHKQFNAEQLRTIHLNNKIHITKIPLLSMSTDTANNNNLKWDMCDPSDDYKYMLCICLKIFCNVYGTYCVMYALETTLSSRYGAVTYSNL